MSLFPEEMTSDRLRYERLHPSSFDPLELYEHVNEDAPHIDEITRYVTWDPYEHPKEAADWVEECGSAFDAGESATYVVRPREGERAGEFAGLSTPTGTAVVRHSACGCARRSGGVATPASGRHGCSNSPSTGSTSTS